MSPVVVKLVSVLMLVVQGLVASAAGRVVCIPLQDCGKHGEMAVGLCDRVAAEGCGGHGGECDERALGSGSHDDGMQRAEECDCHVHVPVPADERLPGKPAVDMGEARADLIPAAVVAVLTWDLESACEAGEGFLPPGFERCDQWVGLKCTRLLL